MTPGVILLLLIMMIGGVVSFYIINSTDAELERNSQAIDGQIIPGLKTMFEDDFATAQQLILPYIQEINEVGDIVRINKAPTQVVQEAVYIDTNGNKLDEDELILQLNSTGSLTEEDVATITGEGSNILEEKYGIDTIYEQVQLDEDYYQIGQFFTLSGQLKKVVPNSCKLQGGEYICEYIDPAKFKYQIDISCKHLEFCSFPTMSRINQDTHVTGSWSQKYIPNTSSGWQLGEYMVTIWAESEVINPNTQKSYEIFLEHKIYIIDGAIVS